MDGRAARTRHRRVFLRERAIVKIVAVGEILWDVFPTGGQTIERLGGAPFNFAVHAMRLGHEVRFLSAVGDDQRGRRALMEVEALRLPAGFIQRVSGSPTGEVTVTLNAGQPEYAIHRPAAYDRWRLDGGDLARVVEFQPDWIYFGTLHQLDPRAKSVTRRLIDAAPRAKRFYDVNLRVNSYTPELVRELMQLASVVKLNDDEFAIVAKVFQWHSSGLEDECRKAARAFGWDAVCVTRGARGCAVLIGEEYAEAEGYRVSVADTVGAGDAFAAAFAHALGEGWSAARSADFANRVGALVASRSGGGPPWTLEECLALRQI